MSFIFQRAMTTTGNPVARYSGLVVAEVNTYLKESIL
jgi:hypothetical protein